MSKLYNPVLDAVAEHLRSRWSPAWVEHATDSRGDTLRLHSPKLDVRIAILRLRRAEPEIVYVRTCINGRSAVSLAAPDGFDRLDAAILGPLLRYLERECFRVVQKG